MRVALCVSGQPRGLPLSCEKLKWGLLETNNDVDIFLHAWFDPEEAGQNFESAQPNQSGRVGIVHPDTKNILIDAFNPKGYTFKPQVDFPWAKNLTQAPSAVQEQLASMFYSMYMANELKKSYERSGGFKYDCVVRVRYDLVYDQQINFEDYKDDLGGCIITSARYQDERMVGYGGYTLTDIFAFGTSPDMDIFSSTYPNFSYINTKIDPPFGEGYLGYNVRVMAGLDIKTIPVNFEIMHRVIDINKDEV